MDRRRSDRRHRETPPVSLYALRGGRRREGGRRPGERTSSFVDLHGAGLFLIVVGVTALNFLDAWFTVYFLSHGGIELNPLVQHILGWGTWSFIVAKSVGIGVCCIVLTITKNFWISRIGIGVVFGGYLLLFGWHLYLLSLLHA
jgi:hypothetical protein